MSVKSPLWYYQQMAMEMPKLLKASRALIVDLLKTRGPMSADELAVELKISDVSIRRHLETLQEAGVVKFEVERHDHRPAELQILFDE